MMQYRQQINQEKYQHQQQRQQQQHQYIETSLDQDLYGIYSATTRKMSIDASIDIPSPANSFYSAPNSRNSSIDMETTVFNVGLLDHRRQFDTKESLYTEPSPPPQQSIIEVTRSAVSNSNIQSLQSTGGGTAAITPDFAAALTVAQCALSQRKKQKDSVPPVGYCCRLCAIEGHWMENCILYISNKYPQYNNAARAVALNIISPNSQVVLNTLPIVQQPQHQYTPKFYAEQMKQELEHQHYLQQRQQQQKYYYSDTTPNSLTSLSPDNVSRFAQIWDN
ncbi:hypothetical protein HK100_010097 [Physocladia obscura]|uniref:Uncharacterized protein n=1 Tax=Physocladia obscura TaxID=109957 RepID=A0AAD5XJ04_9FUNG|nr:hypothetical protein HK100_010097 [Physocladia obscura]